MGLKFFIKRLSLSFFSINLISACLCEINSFLLILVWSMKIFKLCELQIFRSNLFHWITAEGKKKFRKKLCFTSNRGMLLAFFVLYVLTEVGIILNRYFRQLYLKTLKKSNTVSCTIFFFQGFPNLTDDIISL